MAVTGIRLEHFTAFDELNLQPSRGVNVFVGANGTGKTHLLKVAYAACDAARQEMRFADKLARVFARHEARRKYFKDLEAGRKDGDFVAKFRDSFIYQWACEPVDKPIFYLVVIAYGGFDKAMLFHRAEAIRRRLPAGTPKAWRPTAEDVLVFNEETWNELSDFAMERKP